MLKETKSLRELGFKELDSAIPETPLVEKVLNLCEKPLGLFSIEDLRLMIGQNIALEFLTPVAIEILEENPFASGDYYYGDLLQSVLSIKHLFWQENPDLYWQVGEIVAGLPEIMEDLISQIEKFENSTAVGMEKDG